MMLKIFNSVCVAVGFLSLSVWSLQSQDLSLDQQFSRQLQQHFADRMNLAASDFEVKVENLILYPEPAQGREGLRLIQVVGLGSSGSQRLDGLFTISASLENAQKQITEHQVSGILSVTGPVWVSTAILNRGKVLRDSDIALTRLPWKNLASGVALSSKEQMLGRSIKHFVARGTPVFADLLEEAPSVNAGDLVELTVQSGPGVMIRSRAVAKQKGRVGEYIRVEQSDTQKPLQVLVTGDRQVEVRL